MSYSFILYYYYQLNYFEYFEKNVLIKEENNDKKSGKETVNKSD